MLKKISAIATILTLFVAILALDLDFFSPSPGEKVFPIHGDESVEMVWIDMGTSEGFWMGKYEVTQGQWKAVMKTTPWAGRANVRPDSSDHPAVYISWENVQEFIRRLNEVGSGVYRLPTDLEWEYACRAGTTTRWSFGDDESQLTDYAWYKDNARDVGEDYAHRVGTKRANPWGLYDMHGNVREWVQDWYGDYSSSPTGPSSGTYRVLRGGGFNNYAQRVRSAYRGYGSPGANNADLGFRLLRQAD